MTHREIAGAQAVGQTADMRQMEERTPVRGYCAILIGALVFIGLYLTSRYHYLLFHGLAEIFSIVVVTYAYLVTKAHGGEISVASSRTDGTTVKVKLPQA